MKDMNVVKLLECLIANGALSVNELSDKLFVTTRSIYNYIHETNHILPNAVLEINHKYKANINNANMILSKFDIKMPQSPYERVIFIIKILIDNESYDVYDLADALFVSYSTIKYDLSKVKNKLCGYNLQLINSGDILSLKGSENNKRHLLWDILHDKLSSEIINITSFYNDNEYEYTKSVVSSTLTEHNYFINEFSLNGFILHLLIIIDRIKNGYINENKAGEISYIKSHEYCLTNKILDKLEAKFNIRFSESDKYETALILFSRATSLNPNLITMDNLVYFIGEECINITNEMINKLYPLYDLDISDSEFLIRFAIHIKNLLLRCKSNYFAKNPLKYNIQHDYPLIYEISVTLAEVIINRTGYCIPEDEIAYLAFYIGNAVETQYKNKHKLNVIVYYPNFYTLISNTINKIEKIFSEKITIKNIVTSEKNISSDCDFAIVIINSNITLKKIPHVCISTFLTNKDIKKIEELISKVLFDKQKLEFAKIVKNFTNKNLFEICESNDDKTTVIHEMASKLKNLGYVDEDFETNILKREDMASTSFNNFALPHTIELNAKKTAIFVRIYKTSIEWDANKINIVIMLCINDKQKDMFNSIFEPISRILLNHNCMKKLIKINDYEDFTKALINMYT